jgi:hypothetical protein
VSNAPKGMHPVKSGTHEGIAWAIVAGPIAAGNGYVQIPLNHPWHGLHYDDIDVEVHGGLTFNADGWIGFDTAHAFDYWPEKELRRLGGTWRHSLGRFASASDENRWTVKRLIAETKRLAEAVAEAATS